MALLSVQHLTFAYEGSWDDVFTDLTFQVDTRWRLGLVGRNGRGKTTLLRLLMGELPDHGAVDAPSGFSYFPFSIPDEAQPALDVALALAGGAPEWRLRREMSLLSVPEDALCRPFGTLSRGEQTKLQLAALFSRDERYLLIDEPTNHLDLLGREKVGDYLASKDGFLLVSHDRAFLNRCVDHILSLNRSSVSVQKGDFSAFERTMALREQHERGENERLRRDIRRLEQSARQSAQWSAKAEKGKFHVAESDCASLDRGYVGARSAAMMKRAKAVQARREKAVEERGKLLKDVELVGELRLQPLSHPKRALVRVRDAAVRYGENTVCDGIAFTVEQGERVALMGANGAGKSSVLKTLCGLSDALRGDVSLASGLTISYVAQDTSFLRGTLRDFIARNGLDETLFKAILRNMDFGREQFDKDMRDFSEGQKKKTLLAKSLCEPAHLYLWDEPLNFVDVQSRMQLESLILEYKPTILMVEHDRAFLDRTCTKFVELRGREG